MAKHLFVSPPFILGLLCLLWLNGNAQTSNVEDVRQSTIDLLRDYKKELSNYQQQDVQLLKDDINKTILMLKKNDNIDDIIYTHSYFQNALNATNTKKGANISNIHFDLQSKIAFQDSIADLNLENEISFTRVCQIRINAYLNGVLISDKKYRLYWSCNPGENDADIIRKETRDGISSGLSSPYDIQMRLPGNMTIWLVNTDDSSKYIADVSPRRLYTSDKNIDIYFKRL